MCVYIYIYIYIYITYNIASGLVFDGICCAATTIASHCFWAALPV